MLVEDFGAVENGLDEPLLDARNGPVFRPDEGWQDAANGSEAGAVFGYRCLASVLLLFPAPVRRPRRPC